MVQVPKAPLSVLHMVSLVTDVTFMYQGQMLATSLKALTQLEAAAKSLAAYAALDVLLLHAVAPPLL